MYDIIKISKIVYVRNEMNRIEFYFKLFCIVLLFLVDM